ncbi:MAG: cyclic nucleotide-binding domain-containing protein [Desulfobacterales bacterium]|nr:cyclic nucleotide-binding domain-containing protein [Desulfobacterales bacterium]
MDTLKVLAYLCTRENFKSGDFLFHQKDDDGRAFYLISGQARLIHADENGSVTLRDFDKDTFIGSLALLGNSRRLFSLQALTDMTCLILERPKFSKVLEQFPGIMPRVLQALVGSIYSWEKKFLAQMDEGCDKCKRKVGVSMV